jgi:hypothetical protein
MQRRQNAVVWSRVIVALIQMTLVVCYSDHVLFVLVSNNEILIMMVSAVYARTGQFGSLVYIIMESAHHVLLVQVVTVLALKHVSPAK